MAERPDLIPKYEALLLQSNCKEFGTNHGNNHNGKIIKIIETVPSLIGEQMCSICKYITIVFENGEKLELFVKELPTSQTQIDLTNKFDSFPTEANFFNVLLKDLQQIWLEKSGSEKPMDFFPKCLYADDKEIILENLIKGKGYQMNSKSERQNFEFATMAMQNLGKFHGVGYVLLEQLGETTVVLQKYPCLREVLFTVDNSVLTDMLENTKMMALEILNNCAVTGVENALQTLNRYGKDLTSNLIALVAPESQKMLRTIGHGDFWNNNMVFLKHPTTGELIHQVFIDFQCTRIGSPNLDLCYYLFTSVQPKVRQRHWKSLLQSYFNKFKATVELICKEQTEFTFEEFLVDFKAKSLIGFWMGILFSTCMDMVATMDLSHAEGGFSGYFHNALEQWLEKNKDKIEGKAKEIVEICEEYENIMKN